jgi:hypothetical protein
MEVPLSQKVDASFASIGGSTQRGRLRIAQHDDPAQRRLDASPSRGDRPPAQTRTS